MHNHRQKRFKSLENRVRHDLTLPDTPKRTRKSTFDMATEGLEPPLAVSQAKSEEVMMEGEEVKIEGME
jgi:hypothetical protein